MCKKFCFLISIVLLLILTSTSYSQAVIGNWEEDMDGWAIWTEAPEGTTTDYNNTTGVTLNSNSLKLYVPEGGAQQVLYIQLDDEGLVDEFFNNAFFSVDVTRLAEEWTPADPNAYSGVELIVNASSDSGDIFENLGGRIWWSPGDGNNPRKAMWDYSATKYLIDEDSTSYLEFIIVTNFDDVNYPDGTYYLDNAQLLPRADYFVIGDWENTDDGWTDWDTQLPIESPKYTYVPTGATLNSYALKWTPESQWDRGLTIKLQDLGYNAYVAEGLANNKFSIDVTFVRDEWVGSGGECGIAVVINAEGIGYVGMDTPVIDTGNPDNPGDWNPDEYPPGTVYTTTMVWDYSSYIPDITTTVDPPAGHLEFILVMTYDVDAYGEPNDPDPNHPGNYYIDNARLIDGPKASNPTPANSSTDAENKPTLTWRAGRYDDTHDVYFGTDEAKVTNANRTNPLDVLKSQGQDPCSYEPGNLELETTYYWRVDEVNMAEEPTTWKGDVWSFTTGNYLVLDNMESYGDAKTPGPPPPPGSRIWYTWKDGEGWTMPSVVEGNGSGSVVDRKDDPVHGGTQSLGYWYDNDGTNARNHSGKDYYSEVKADTSHLMAGQDWTKDGVKSLTLWFYGNPNNDANATEQMYVKLNDEKVNYDGDMNDIREASWHEWNIDLAAFGIDLTNVTEIAIGFGDENNTTTPGGSGVVYFDDIRLYQTRCVLSKRSDDFAKVDYAPVGQVSGDCVIDYQEIEIMADDWSFEDNIIYTATDPGTNGLVGYYPLDEGTGFTTVDASGNGHDGDLYGGVTWVTPGYMGSAINFNGTAGQMVDIGIWDPAAGTDQITLAIWAKWAGPAEHGRSEGLIGKRDDWSTSQLKFMFEVNSGGNGSFGFRSFARSVYAPENIMIPYIDQWVHLAATFDGTTTARLYLNGEEVASGAYSFGTKTGAGMGIGNTHGSTGWGGNSPEVFNGDLDEAYIYNRPLDDDEIAWLANPGGGEVYVPLTSPAELYDAEAKGSRVVNLKDFAILADYWLEKQLWP